MDILDQYVVRVPEPQNVLDLFDGEWSSRMPVTSGLTTRSGTATLFDDSRIVWAEQQLGPFTGDDILELGPLECGHTYMLHERGAKSIVAIEANSRAFLKCLCVKELLGLNRANLQLGDFVAFLRQNEKKFDVTIASGVLYHMQNPIEVLDMICRSTDKLFVWTHYYDSKAIAASPMNARRFAALETGSYRRFEYEFCRQAYEKVHLNWAGFCGGPSSESVWLSRESIVGFLHAHGFPVVNIGFEQPDHQNGPAFAICARRQ